MRATELIRSILDFIDKETIEPKITMINMTDPEDDMPKGSEEERRMNQVKDLVPDDDCGCDTEYSNSPNEQYADIEAVTTDAGGGINEPKHPADIRGEHPSLFSDYLRKLENKE